MNFVFSRLKQNKFWHVMPTLYQWELFYLQSFIKIGLIFFVKLIVSMRIFHALNSLVISRYLWLILLSKTLLLSNLVKPKNSKILNIPKMCLIFSLALVVVEFLAILWFFKKINVVKHIWDRRCHLVAETGSRFPLILWHIL